MIIFYIRKTKPRLNQAYLGPTQYKVRKLNLPLHNQSSQKILTQLDPTQPYLIIPNQTTPNPVQLNSAPLYSTTQPSQLKFNIVFKLSISKISFCKNPKYFITSSRCAQFRNLWYQYNQEITSYTLGQNLCLWQSKWSPKVSWAAIL